MILLNKACCNDKIVWFKNHVLEICLSFAILYILKRPSRTCVCVHKYVCWLREGVGVTNSVDLHNVNKTLDPKAVAFQILPVWKKNVT